MVYRGFLFGLFQCLIGKPRPLGTDKGNFHRATFSIVQFVDFFAKTILPDSTAAQQDMSMKIPFVSIEAGAMDGNVHNGTIPFGKGLCHCAYQFLALVFRQFRGKREKNFSAQSGIFTFLDGFGVIPKLFTVLNP